MTLYERPPIRDGDYKAVLTMVVLSVIVVLWIVAMCAWFGFLPFLASV